MGRRTAGAVVKGAAVGMGKVGAVMVREVEVTAGEGAVTAEAAAVTVTGSAVTRR